MKRLARVLDLPHRTMRWAGDKPKTGLPAAARAARYRLLAQAARTVGATHILTAHTRDDQAETLLMRLLRGSGIAGLAAMARENARDGVVLARPFLNVPKSRLVATLDKAKIVFADDPTNHDTAFTRPRLRALLPLLAAEGGDARGLARLAARLARANAAVEVLVDGARVLSCLTLAVAVRGPVTTIEGLAEPGGRLHPMQQAFIDQDAFQCGYCTPGQIMSAVACVNEGHAGNDDDIREYMSGNICRCAAYPNIVAAVKQAASEIKKG